MTALLIIAALALGALAAYEFWRAEWTEGDQ